jgi:undecaprenyl-diphosphatase
VKNEPGALGKRPIAAGIAFSGAFAASLLAATSALLLFAWLAEAVFRDRTAGNDLLIREFVHQHSSPALTGVMRMVTVLGSPGVAISVAAVAMVIFWLLHFRAAAVWMALATLGAILLDQTLKACFSRVRPLSFFDFPQPHSSSFPSGHALMSFCIYGMLAGLMVQGVARPKNRAFIWIVTVALVLAIGYSRIYLGVHYPTDVVAGYLSAAVWIALLLSMATFRRDETRSS